MFETHRSSFITRSALASLLFIVACSLGCGGRRGGGESVDGGTSSSFDGAVTSSNIGGAWSGTWISTAGVSGGFTSAVAQSGASLSGTLTLSGSPCLTTATVAGTVSGSVVHLTASAGGMSLVFDGNFVGDSMSGTYTSHGGACDGDVGSFIASR